VSHRAVMTSEADTLHPFDFASFWAHFQHGTATVGGVRLHYVEGGSGAPVLLLPGWPQSWYAWRFVMPLLAAAGRRVIALDPRGMGDSDRPTSGYDVGTVAAEIHAFVDHLHLTERGPVDVVAHDIGTWLAFAYAADWPSDIRRLAVFEAVLPGITSPPPPGMPSAEANVKTWHFAFNRLDDLPEILIQGREREFLTWLFRAKAVRPWTIGASDMDEYVRVNTSPGACRAALSYYRQAATPEGLAQSRARAEQKIHTPVLAFGADSGTGDAMLKTMQLVATDVRGGVFENCGHYVAEEAPRALAATVVDFWSG
jgi:pimeloyl-ACP methyl ester carboxylesterase